MSMKISTGAVRSSAVERASLRLTRAADDASCLLSLVLYVGCRARRPTARTRRCAVLRHAMPCAFVWRFHDATQKTDLVDDGERARVAGPQRDEPHVERVRPNAASLDMS